MIGWVSLIIGIIAFFVVYKLIKSVIKTFLVFSFIALIIMGIFTFIIFKNMNEFKDNFPDSKKLIIVEENGTLLSASQIITFDLQSGELPDGIEPEELNKLNVIYQEEGLEGIKGDNFLVILMKKEFFKKGLSNQMDFGDGLIYTWADFLKIYDSDTPSDIIIDRIVNKNDYDDIPEVREQLKKDLLPNSTESDFKSMYVIMGFSDIMNNKGTPYMIQQIKEETFVIHPDFVVFKFVKYIPNFIINNVVKNKDPVEVS